MTSETHARSPHGATATPAPYHAPLASGEGASRTSSPRGVQSVKFSFYRVRDDVPRAAGG